MMQGNHVFRPATKDDAGVLAELVNYAGEGLPLYLWQQMAGPDETAWDVGRRRAARDEGSFSYRNATIIESNDQCAGCLIGYDIPDLPEKIPDTMPAIFVPLQELENLAPGTWYINVLAVLPHFRRRGLGTSLIALAEATARARGKNGVSLIVADTNKEARQLYQRCGYSEHARRRIVKENWVSEAEYFLLLAKEPEKL
jgi:ribosomal protein S18 acetylase RimI-like enzyme